MRAAIALGTAWVRSRASSLRRISAEVILDSASGNAERPADLLVGIATRDKAQDCKLARTQACGGWDTLAGYVRPE